MSSASNRASKAEKAIEQRLEGTTSSGSAAAAKQPTPQPNHVIVGTPVAQPESRSRRIHSATDKKIEEEPTDPPQLYDPTPMPTSERVASAKPRPKSIGTSEDGFHGRFKYNHVRPSDRPQAPSPMEEYRRARADSARRAPVIVYGKTAALEEIPWNPIVVGNEDPSVLSASKPWMSQPSAGFPIDIVLGLQTLANIYKVVVEVDQSFYPALIEVSIGRGLPGDKPDYNGARRAQYGVKGEMVFRKREKTRMEAKTFYADHIGNFVWLIVQKPFSSSSNEYEQVGIEKIVVLGYPMSETFGLAAEERKKQRAESAERRRRSASRRKREESARTPTPKPPTPKPTVLPPWQQNPNPLQRGTIDGMVSTGGGLASDPLTTVRTVKTVLGQKMESAQERGLFVEANTCRRAVQRLDEYEARLEDLASRKKDALINNDHDEAKRIDATMADVRDTAFRSVHVDLLLSRSELRSIGVSSQWAAEQ